MHWLNLAIKNVLYRPLSGFLSVLLFAISVGLVTFLSQINDDVKTKFEKNLAEVDLVVGAKGSPLQLILCNMYHIDAPTGNISLKEAQPFLRSGHPLIKSAVPLSLGDSHKGYRIVGTNDSFLERYEVEIKEGKIWTKPMDVLLGSTVAQKLSLSIGDHFQSAHGLSDNEDMLHSDAPSFVVTAILESNGSVVDQLILTPTQSIWAVHESHDHDEEVEDKIEEADINDERIDHDGHQHEEDSSYVIEIINPLPSLLEINPKGKEVTSLLLEFKGRNFQSLNMARNINENTNMMAASPAMEINRLYAMMGVGMNALEYLVYLMAIVAFVSVFISLLQALKSRKYEIAVLKSEGASPFGVFWTTCLEALFIALIGAILGVFFGKMAISLMGSALEETYRYSFTAWQWSFKDLYIIGIALMISVIAALVPAISASRMNIHETLSQR